MYFLQLMFNEFYSTGSNYFSDIIILTNKNLTNF